VAWILWQCTLNWLLPSYFGHPYGILNGLIPSYQSHLDKELHFIVIIIIIIIFLLMGLKNFHTLLKGKVSKSKRKHLGT
jgi:hypothetical protein